MPGNSAMECSTGFQQWDWKGHSYGVQQRVPIAAAGSDPARTRLAVRTHAGTCSFSGATSADRSRSPAIPDADYQRILAMLAGQGYDVTKIEKVPQRW